MVVFIDLLRAIATVLITNSHYANVYPISFLANGGMLGNIIFFAVSGFCLSNIKLPFHKWYAKRLFRIYPIVWVAILFFCLIGKYSITSPMDFFNMLIFPTMYHFVGSIILLYIPYYIFVTIDKKFGYKSKERFDFTVIAFILTVVISLLIYIFAYDKSYYHIDTVEEPFILFLYFEAMLIGYYFKKKLAYFENKKGKLKWFVTAILFVVYFISKLVFSNIQALSRIQIVNQYILLCLLAGIVMCVVSLSDCLEKMPIWIKSVVSHIAKITLEIYVVQYVIIARFDDLPFPINWIVITVVIVAGATVLHYLVGLPNKIKKIVRKK